MDEFETDLSGFIGRELLELAWHKDYPINPSASIWSYFQAFMDGGFKISLDDKEKKAIFEKSQIIENPIFSLDTLLFYEDILNGWGGAPKGSLRSLYDSIYLVYDNLGGKRGNFLEGNNWSKIRNTEPIKIRERMEGYLLPYFIAHHEHMFLPVKGEIPNLDAPKIFPDLIKKFPMKTYRQATFFSSYPLQREVEGGYFCGPSEETLLESDFENDFDESYFPSEASMDQLFLGKYLYEFSKVKNYSVNNSNNNQEELRNLVVGGISAFQLGNNISFEIKNF